MQALYFLCAILTHSLSSLALSLLLPFHHLLRWFCHPDPDPNSISLYQGTIWHERRHPIHHSFKLSARYALIDLDLTTHPPPNHLSASEARRAAGTNGPVLLLTIPPSVGYQRSPVTLYYCYDIQGSTHILNKCIVEVSNTPWCEKVLFSFDPNSDLVAKTLQVSPFMDMLGNWSIKTRSPGKNLFVKVSVDHPQLGNYFTATLTAKRVSSLTPIDHAIFFWLMPHKAVVWTYWQAFKLWWKNVPFYQHPGYDNSSYREEALVREQKLQCRFQELARGTKCNSPKVEGPDIIPSSDSISLPSVKVGERWFTWREAKWQWKIKKGGY